MVANCLDPMLTNRIHLWFPHKNLSTFLQIRTTNDSNQSLGISTLGQIDSRSSVTYDVKNCPQSMTKDGNSPSDPALLHLLRKPTSLMTSISDRGLVSTCTGSSAGINEKAITLVAQLN